MAHRTCMSVFHKTTHPSVFKKAWYRVCKLENALHGFQRCGLFPLCPDNIDISKLNSSKIRSQTEISNTLPKADGATAVTSKAVPEATVSLKQNSDKRSTTTPATHAGSTDQPFTESQVLSMRRPEDVVSLSGDNDITPPINVAVNAPGPSGSITIVSKDANKFVSRSFELLSVPELPRKKATKNIRQKLPKAISGSEAIKMMTDKETKKREEEEAKERRKKEKAEKKIIREQEQLMKKKAREEKKKERERLKCLKISAGKRRKLDESSSDSDEDDHDEPQFDDSDDDYDETAQCPGCQTDDGDVDEWVKCTMCPAKWHASCTGDVMLFELPVEQISAYPFVCENCLS